jgi:Tol biopolymer transport system component
MPVADTAVLAASQSPEKGQTEEAFGTRTSPLIARHRLLFSYSRAVWIIAGLIVLSVGAYTLHSLAFPRELQFTGIVQITDDGADKVGLVTDGDTVYFGEYQGSRIVLASVPAEGGPVRIILTPFVRVAPADVSPDGKNLLVLAWEGEEEDRTLWILPVTGGHPRRVGEIHCHAAVWSPDGSRIAFAEQNTIYITSDQGSTNHQLQTFSGNPEYLRWSPDGRRLRVSLRNPESTAFSFWDIALSSTNRNQVSSIVPLNIVLRNSWGNSMTLDAEGRSFARGGESGAEKVFLIGKSPLPWKSTYAVSAMDSMVGRPIDLTLDPKSSLLFALGDSAGPQSGTGNLRVDLLRYDRHSREFAPFLPDISGIDVDFSRDGRRIAYVRVRDQTLWISDPDGAHSQRVDIQAYEVELPRWSPDGKWLAFMAESPQKPWRIFVVSADGGIPHEASTGHDSQGAPTWSPDGKWLVYGNVKCEEAGTCQIHKIDLSNQSETTIPGSEGLGTARWSPDGQYVAALDSERHKVLVFDVKSQQWRELAQGVNGNDLSWSADSRSLYASRPNGSDPEILRISLADDKVETAVDLSAFSKLTGHIDTWFTLAPDGSIIFLRELGGEEIYALRYKEKQWVPSWILQSHF